MQWVLLKSQVNSVGASEIATNAIAAAQLQASAVTGVADNSIDSAAIAANSWTPVNLYQVVLILYIFQQEQLHQLR